jgi:LysR family transcriptional regulator, transcriptional activator for dmlA
LDAFSDLSLVGAIVRRGGMASAAQELGVTPPVVSRRLAALERRLGVRLLNRTTRRLSLTPEGEIYLQEGTRILDALATLELRVGGGSLQPQGILKIAATLGFGRIHLAPAVSEFARAHAHVDVRLHLTDQPIALIDQGFDLMVRFGEPGDSRLTARLLAHNQRLLCAAPAYLAAHGSPSHPRELAERSCIVVREADETFGTWHLRNGAQQEVVKVRGNLSSNDGSSALAWAIEGHGILLRSQWDIAQALRAGALVPVLPDWRVRDADVYLVYQTQNEYPAKVRALVGSLLARFEPFRRPGDAFLGPW